MGSPALEADQPVGLQEIDLERLAAALVDPAVMASLYPVGMVKPPPKTGRGDSQKVGGQSKTGPLRLRENGKPGRHADGSVCHGARVVVWRAQRSPWRTTWQETTRNHSSWRQTVRSDTQWKSARGYL